MLVILLLFVAVAVGDVWGIREASAAAGPIKLRMVISKEPVPREFSPLQGFSSSTGAEISSVLEPLVDHTKDGPVPKLATKWEKSADFTRWRFYLRRGVKFHNGDNFTARDVVEVVKWSFEEKKVSQLYQRLPIKEAVAVDDYTVDLIFETPQPLLLITIRQLRIAPTAITRDNREMAGTHPIGTGPYKFVEWKRGLSIKLTKFEGYWGAKPQIDEVEITFKEEEGVRLAALMAGEVDWVSGLNPEQASQVPKVARIPSPDTVWLRFDEYIQKALTGKDPILSDKRLRLAVEYAIDRKALVALYKGFATPSLGQFAVPGDFGFNPNLKSRPYDLERAKALVRESGAVGKTVTFVASTDRFSKDREVAEALAYMIEQTGLKVKLMLMPYTEYVKYRGGGAGPRPYMADIVLIASDTLLEVETRISQLFMQGGNYNAINDPEPTRLFKEEQAETDYAKRAEKLSEIWAYVYEQAHYVPLYKLEWMWGIAKNLEWKLDNPGCFIFDMRFTDR